MTQTTKVVQRIAMARTSLVLDHPYFGTLALRMVMREAPPSVTTTMATDGRSIFYSAAHVETLTDDELIGELAHEVMHPAMQHHTRRDNRDPKRWNEACDYAINPVLVEAGFTLPAGGLNNPAFAGLTAEKIYEALQTQDQDDQDQGGGQGGDQPGDDGTGDGTGNGDGNGTDDGTGTGDEPGNPLANVPGAVLDAPDATVDAAEWAVAVKQAALAAQVMGKLPGSIARAIDEATRPRIDWKAVLRRFVQQCASADYSWRMPNRRYLAGGLYLPELRSESMPPMVIAVDTSGSIDDAVLAKFNAEIQSIVDEVKPEAVHVVYCDARVQRVDVFARGEQVTMNAQGGGGTDFRPVFDYVGSEGIQPSCVVYLTDGEGTYPATPAECPTLWVMTSRMVAPWGETIAMEG